MSTATVARRPASGSLAEVIDIILDKGLVIDAYVRISLLGLELITIDARVVVASVDTFLHFAEATNRLDLQAKAEASSANLQDLMSGFSAQKAEGAIEGGARKLRSMFGSGEEEREEAPQETGGKEDR